MIAKAGAVAAAIIVTVVGGRAIDLRGLYDQMYPVSTLKRDVLNLCVQSDPAFIRALSEQREACYFRMPHAIEVALGLARPDTALEELFSPWLRLPGGEAVWAATFRQPPREVRLAAGSKPCRADSPPEALAQLPATGVTAPAVLAGRPDKRDEKALAALGLAPFPRPSLTVLPAPQPMSPVATPANPAAASNLGPTQSLILLDTEAAADLGDKASALSLSRTGCSAPI
jgi:hypothetical protein